MAVLSGVIPLAAVALAVARRDLRPAWASLLAVALMAAASLVTLLMPLGEPLQRLGQPWLMALVGLAGFELLRRGRLPLAAWMPPAGLAVILVAWGVMVGLGASLPTFARRGRLRQAVAGRPSLRQDAVPRRAGGLAAGPRSGIGRAAGGPRSGPSPCPCFWP